jgi:NAD(P)-dependent dehydrogenase (short-subunit alcohol dehydrogenase family)
MQRFNGQVVIVTGAAHGIGRGISAGFCREGASVNGFDIDSAGLQATAQALNAQRERFYPATVDVSDFAGVVRSIEAVREKFGRIDVLVNNAGINMNKRIAELDLADWDRTFDINLKSMFVTSKAVWPVFKKQRAGVIVNISSIMGQAGGVSAPAYCSTKAAIIMLSRCLAKDGAPLGIRVNSVCPGYIDTPIMDRMLAEQPDPEAMRREILNRQPLGRLGTAEDIAQGVLFLSSREASFISGIALTIDGAVTATQID